MHNHDSEYGVIELVLEFSVPLPQPVTVIVEKQFNKVLINDKLSNSCMSIDVESG